MRYLVFLFWIPALIVLYLAFIRRFKPSETGRVRTKSREWRRIRHIYVSCGSEDRRAGRPSLRFQLPSAQAWECDAGNWRR